MSSGLLLSVVLSFLAVAQSTTCGKSKSKNYETRVRYYCIAAMDIDWDYAAFSTEEMYDLTGQYEENAQQALAGDEAPQIGRYARKGLLRQFPYSAEGGCDWDENSMMVSSAVERNGILGPVIRAVEGDLIKIFFYNNAYSLYNDEPDAGDDDGALMGNAFFNLVPEGVAPSKV